MAEREEGLWMSTKERDRLKVLHEVKKRYITQKRAGAELGLSERRIRGPERVSGSNPPDMGGRQRLYPHRV